MRCPRVPFAIFLSLWIALFAVPVLAKGWKPIPLKHASVGIADLVPGQGGRSTLAIPIHSDSDVRLAVSVRSSRAAAECDAHMTLPAGRDTVVTCPIEVVPDVDYVISLAAFADSSERDTLEAGSSSARFSKGDVKALGKWLEASALPKTFKHIEKVDKVSAGTTMSSMFGVPHGEGTLLVDSTSVTYDAKKNSVTIPASAIRDVRLNSSDPKQPWVVIDYEEAGEKKSVSFKPNVYKGGATAEEIAAAIRALPGWGAGK